MQSEEHAHAGTVTFEHLGRTYTAMYEVAKHTITVSTGTSVRSAPLSATPIDSQARALLHTMILEGEAEPGAPPAAPHPHRE